MTARGPHGYRWCDGYTRRAAEDGGRQRCRARFAVTSPYSTPAGWTVAGKSNDLDYCPLHSERPAAAVVPGSLVERALVATRLRYGISVDELPDAELEKSTGYALTAFSLACSDVAAALRGVVLPYVDGLASALERMGKADR